MLDQDDFPLVLHSPSRSGMISPRLNSSMFHLRPRPAVRRVSADGHARASSIGDLFFQHLTEADDEPPVTSNDVIGSGEEQDSFPLLAPQDLVAIANTPPRLTLRRRATRAADVSPVAQRPARRESDSSNLIGAEAAHTAPAIASTPPRLNLMRRPTLMPVRRASPNVEEADTTAAFNAPAFPFLKPFGADSVIDDSLFLVDANGA